MKQIETQALVYDPNRESTWCVHDRPANKLANMGVKALTETELIASLLTGLKNPTTVARALYAKANNDLNTLSQLSIEQLVTVEGMTALKAVALRAAFELGRRANSIPDRTPIKSSESVYNLMQPIIADLPHEEFWLICLNRANRVVGKHKISQGGISGTVIDTRIILKKALECLSCSIIVVHNHPSGNIQPSDADVKITEKLKQGAEFMEIKILDHVIVSDQGYYSFADEGLLL